MAGTRSTSARRSIPYVRFLLALLVLAAPLRATWSIVVVNAATGEVCAATATCLENFNIKTAVPVLVVGQGAGAAQSLVDSGAVARLVMWNGFMAGDTPQQILDDVLAAVAGINVRQYGIASFDGDPVTYTGVSVGAANAGVSGTVGDLRYAIQGNLITGPQVVSAARNALLTTNGDLGQKVMAAMEAARALGGDGRCSCAPFAPTSCGVPPPAFDKAAHTSTIVLGRIGDSDGDCNAAQGCANGDYYLDLVVVGDDSDPDPVIVMQGMYDAWRLALLGHADGLTSTFATSAESVPADGQAGFDLTLELLDVDGAPITNAPVLFDVTGESGLVSYAGGFTDNGDGTWTLPIVAGNTIGTESLVVLVDDGSVQATIYPFPQVDLDAPAALHCGYDEVSAASGAEVPFTIDFGAGSAGSSYVLLGSVSGTVPGIPIGGGLLPLNFDVVTEATLLNPGPPLLPGFAGVLDGAGRATAQFVVTPGLLAAAVGLRFDFAAVSLGTPKTPSNADGFDVLP